MSNAVESSEVCLVDDDRSVLRSMEYLLASDGLKVRAFNKPEEFLAHAVPQQQSGDEDADRPAGEQQIGKEGDQREAERP